MKKKEPYKPIIHFFLISRKEKTLTEGDQNDTSAKTAYFQSHGKRERGRQMDREKEREREGGENRNKGVTLITVKYVSQ